jgi:predicted enzyme related to lactoylglutathione lyase
MAMTNPIAHFEIMGKDAIRLQAFYTETLTIALFADPAGNTVGMLTEQPT